MIRLSPQDIDAIENFFIDEEEDSYLKTFLVIPPGRGLTTSQPRLPLPDQLPPDKKWGRPRPSGRGKIGPRPTLSQMDGEPN